VQAFEIVERPALDSLESALDRLKMAIYAQCARWGVPCPITGSPVSDNSEAMQEEQQAQAR
jgi:cytochrome c heme-lyase